MADDLKFGPEWLRALTDGSNVTSPPVSPGFVQKNKLSDFKYGREEMLALFVPNSFVPENLKFLSSICMDKVQHPLAFVPLNEEEQHLIAQGVNSSAVLRMMGIGGTVARGRGINDRGRGRGRGRGEAFTTKESEDNGFGRGRTHHFESWDERIDKRFEKPGFGQSEPEDIPTSPHKDLVRSLSSDNWRDGKKEHNENDAGSWWRTGTKERTLDGKGNWRERDIDAPSNEKDSSGYANNRHNKRTEDHEEDDDLPEWSVAEAHGDIGTFDSSGAFLSVKKRNEKEAHTGIMLEKMQKENESISHKICENNPADIQNCNTGIKTRKNSHKNEEQHPNMSRRLSYETITLEKLSEKTMASNTKHDQNNKIVSKEDEEKNKNLSINLSKINKEKINKTNENNVLQGEEDLSSVVLSSLDSLSVIETENVKNFENKLDHSSVLPIGVAKTHPGDIVDNYLKEEPIKHKGNLYSSPRKEKVDMKKDVSKPAFRVPENPVANHLKEDASSDSICVSFSGYSDNVLSLQGENAPKWFYQDPQGEMQGPFNAPEMAEWFSAGYFTMNLMVKQGKDEKFSTLGELIKRWGRVPFLPGTSLSPEECNQTVESMKYQPEPDHENAVSMATQSSVGVPDEINDVQKTTPQEQLKTFLFQQHQAALMQQQAAMRQFQMQQTIQLLHQKEVWNKMPQEQQQHATLQMMMKQQADQQCAKPVADQQPEKQIVSRKLDVASEHLNKSSFQQQHVQSVSQNTVHPPGVSVNKTPLKSELKTMSEENSIAASIWGALNNKTVSGNWTPTSSVWDVEQSGKAKSLEEIEKEELANAYKQKKNREEENTAKESEKITKQKQVKSLHSQKMLQNERSRESKKKTDVKKQKQIDVEKNQTREFEEQIDKESYHEKGEAENLVPEKIHPHEKRQEVKTNSQMSKDRQKQQEGKRIEEQNKTKPKRDEVLLQQNKQKETLKQEMPNMKSRHGREGAAKFAPKNIHQDEKRHEANKNCQMSKEGLKQEEDIGRVDEIKMRHVKCEEEIQRQKQQKHTLSHMQQEKMLDMKLPQQAQWGSSLPAVHLQSNNCDLSLQQIQELEAEKERKEQVEICNKKIKEQLESIQQQQEKATWVKHGKQHNQQPDTKSLLEIQQEQAKQHLKDIQEKQVKSKHQAVAAPVSNSSVWSGQESSWGSNVYTKTTGFWEDSAGSITNNKPKTAKINTTHFPALTSSVCRNTQSKAKEAKVKKEEETVQQLFQSMIPKDDFTEWCENALQKFETSVDVPTFITFLSEVDSPYEVHDYARQFLGETRETNEFAKLFLENRLQYRSKQTSRKNKDTLWELPAAKNTILSGNTQGQSHLDTNPDDVGQRKGKRSKKVKRIDNSILGFTCTAATERVNVGEIDNL